MKSVFVSMAIAGLVTTSAFGDDAREVRALISGAEAAFRTCDARAWEGLLSNTATIFFAGGPVQSKSDHQAFMTSECEAGVKYDGAFEILDLTVSGDLAVAHGYWSGNYVPPSGDPVWSKSRVTYIATRDGGGWKTYHLHISPLS